MSLKHRLQQKEILIAPGVYDGLTASLATAAGFGALYLSGAAVAYTRLGRPDIGLTSVTEMADTMSLIADRTELPVIIDADTGFGNALNAQRTMRLYERAGASALQVEDQTYPKRCGHLSDKSLIPAKEMAGKVQAMADAQHFVPGTYGNAPNTTDVPDGFLVTTTRSGSVITATVIELVGLEATGLAINVNVETES